MPLPSPVARVLLAAAAVAAAVAAAGAEVRVEVKDAQVDLTATAAPLAEVLERLGRQTGLKVVYEGAAPRQLVNVTLTRRTTAEAVLALLEGQGLNFALVYDATGTKPATLLVAGTPGGSAVAAAPRPVVSAPRRVPFAPPPGSGANAAEPPFDEGDEEPEEEPLGVDTVPAEVGATPGEAPAGLPGAGFPAPAAPTATSPVPQAPQQQFPVSPFAPRPLAPAPVVPAAPQPATPTGPPPAP